MENKNNINIKFNGYRPTHRNKWFFITNGVLSIQELAYWEFCIDLMDFNKDHQDFGCFKVNFTLTASIFRCKSKNTIRNWHNKLLRIGLIKNTGDKSLCQINLAEKFVNPGFWKGKAAEFTNLEKGKSFETILQNFGIDLQTVAEKLQSIVKKRVEKPKKLPSIALDSSKVDSSFIPKQVFISQPIRTNEEYQRIYGGGGYKLLLPDDMRWIDENIKEKNITIPTLEEKVIEVFFNNDFELYQQSIID